MYFCAMRQLKNSIAILSALMAVYSLLRLGFLLSNQAFYAEISGSEILLAFLHGLRFDVAAILWLNAPLVLLYTIPYKPLQWKWYRGMLTVLFLALNVAGLLLNIADYGYYPTVQRRLSYELSAMPTDILGSMPGLILHHFMLFMLFIASCALFVWGVPRFLRWIGAGIKGKTKFYFEVPAFLLVFGFLVVGIRGGLQLKPIRPTNAFFTAHPATGYLTLNTTYTVIRSWFQETLPRYRLIDDQMARNLIEEMLYAPGEKNSDPEYVFMRERMVSSPDEAASSSFAPEQRKNIVVIIMESWSAQSIGALSDGKSVTPFFDSLSTHGMLFTNFIASGQRSIEAVPAILASVPALSNSSLIGSKEELHAFRGLGSILSEIGYTTSFHHGAALGSMGFDAFTRIAGFEHYYSKEDMPDLRDDMLDGVWGVYDEPFLRETARRIGEMHEPFCSVIFSLSSHDPFHLPVSLKFWKERYKTDTEFEMSLRYSDYALQQFFAAARKQPWFRNTVFVLTGDHTFYSIRNNLRAAYNVPLWIFDPQQDASRRVPTMGSQVDVMPTLFDLLHMKVRHASMGTSLLDSTRSRYAVVKFGPQFVIFDDSLALMHDLEKVVGLYNYRKDPFSKKDLQAGMPGDVERMRMRLFAYLQKTTSAIVDDKVYRMALKNY